MKGLKLKLLLVCAILLFVGAPLALADWDPQDGHKMHWPQEPKMDGWDVSWTNVWSLGDDWQCSQTGPVEDIHFWVSFKYGEGDPCNILNFNVEIWSNDPCGMSDPCDVPWSHPDELLWMYVHPTFTYRYVDTAPEGWFDPFQGSYNYPDHFGCWQINITDIPDPCAFIQQEDEIYWLIINDMVTSEFIEVGWKQSGSDSFMDDAVWWDGTFAPFWNEIYDPCTYESMDLAFVITGGEEEPETVVKWSQPPVPYDPCFAPNVYEGWDESSDELLPNVLDDFRCDTDLPVIHIRWWGSYLGYYDEEVPAQDQDMDFYITFWTDVPAGPFDPCDPCDPCNFSHPGELIHEIYCDNYTVDFYGREWDPYDPCANPYDPCNLMAKFEFNQVLDPCDYWYQPGDSGIYWLGIMAIYNEDPLYRWGWETRPHFFQDDAVCLFADPRFDAPPYPWFYYQPIEIFDETWDLSFELLTEPEPEPGIKWSQPPVPYDPCYAPNVYEGWDEESDELLPNVLDDFRCVTDLPVNHIRWWGSYLGYYEEEVPVQDMDFYITFWTDVPADPCDPCDPCNFSHPGELIHEIYCDNYTVDFYGREWDPWDPCANPYDPCNLMAKFEFNQVLDPCDYWYQPGDSGIYWLGIMAIYNEEPGYLWGWETRPHFFQDDAVRLWTDPRSDPTWPYPWFYYEPIEGPQGETWDLSFELISEPEGPEPKEPVPDLKWSQPPIEYDPTEPEPRFCGWDEISFTNDPCNWWRVAADDFRCFGSMPIDSVHWWGSHIGWDGDEPPAAAGMDPPIIGWRIGFWTNVGVETVAVDVVDYSDGQPDTYFLPPDVYPTNPPYYRWYDEDWGWTHTFSPPNPAPASINWARLDIKAFDVNGDEYNLITGDGGWLETKHDLDHHHNMEWHTTTFTLDPAALANLMDGTLDTWMDIDSTHDARTWAVTIEKSTLTVNYVPAGSIMPYSHPGQLLWQIEVDAARVPVERVGVDEHPYYEGFPETCFQYYVDLEPEEVFWQEEFLEDTQNDVFWISIVAMYPEPTDPCDPCVPPTNDPCHPWGWKTRPWSWMDDGVSFELNENPWEGMVIDPCSNNTAPLEYEGESYDLAFELDTDPNWIKWDQPFTGFRHWPHYEDIESWMEWWPEGSAHLYVAADDWPCTSPLPVTALAWWGSYLGYEYQPCDPCYVSSQPEKPAYFDVSIWTDVPADPCDPCSLYSHPDIKVWEYNVYNFDEILVGYDKHPEDPCGITGHEPVFRYTARIPEENWFWQDEAEQVYWLSIVAVYEEHYPEYEWGWTNHQHVYNDDAVTGDPCVGVSDWVWEPLEDQTGETADMSFTIYTDPYAEQPVEETDFGDAPDPCYPTLLANNGASHVIVPGLYLGNGIDAELDGQPDPCALGDDNDGNDDEDGVVFTSLLIHGQQATVDVTASASGFLNAWMDFNADGDWADPCERIFNDVALIAGVNSLIFQIPASTPGNIQTFARFRFTSTGFLWFACWANPRQCHGDADGMQEGMCWVSTNDLIIFMAAYPSTYPTPPYDECADFDRDGDVDPADQAILTTWFNQPFVPADCPTTGGNYLDYYGPTDDGEVEDYRVFIEAVDYGDAPDPCYPTLLANDGARHVIAGPWFGPADDKPDDDADGQPTPLALGDDSDGNDDEDGITIPTLIRNATQDISVHVSGGPANVYGWIDFNDDGDWNDAGELIINGTLLPNLVNLVPVTVPNNAAVGDTFARFRIISSGGSADPCGLWDDGEVEDHKVTIRGFDFGDAPDPNYPTLLASNGARHVVDEVTYLGAGVDVELDGQPDASALGDDNDGNDDEDGVVFTTPLVPGQPASVNVTVSVAGQLNAWIDYWDNGDWADPVDQVFTNQPLAAGLNTLPFIVPLSAAGNIDTFARFRFNIGGGLSYTGQADDGEVEDYRVHIEYKRKWSQPPVEIELGLYYGWDEYSIYGGMQIAGDDWPCDDQRPVSDIHWWGSYYGWEIPEPPQLAPIEFHIGIWTDVPLGDPCNFYPYSHPGRMIWEYNATMADVNEEWVGFDFHELHPIMDTCFRYDLQLPEEQWFWQEGGETVYWLTISAIYDGEPPPEWYWGWKTRQHFYNDDAIRIYMPTAPMPGIEFMDGEPILPGWDLAFELTTQECVKPDAPFYNEWVGAGQKWAYPKCWCYERNCRGDADGVKTGIAWVNTPDLTIFVDAFGKADFKLDQTKICADFDHIKTGVARVNTPDLTIFVDYFGKAEFKVPVCSKDWEDLDGPGPGVGDGDDDYNFWTN